MLKQGGIGKEEMVTRINIYRLALIATDAFLPHEACGGNFLLIKILCI